MRWRAANNHRRRRDRAAGFTLLEVLVAALILAVGAATILGHVRTLLDYHQRATAHQRDVRALVNRSILLAHQNPNTFDRQVEQEHMTLEMPLPGGGTRALRVTNRGRSGSVVPVSMGFSPFQVFHLSQTERYELNLVGPGLTPDDRS